MSLWKLILLSCHAQLNPQLSNELIQNFAPQGNISPLPVICGLYLLHLGNMSSLHLSSWTPTPVNPGFKLYGFVHYMFMMLMTRRLDYALGFPARYSQPAFHRFLRSFYGMFKVTEIHLWNLFMGENSNPFLVFFLGLRRQGAWWAARL